MSIQAPLVIATEISERRFGSSLLSQLDMVVALSIVVVQYMWSLDLASRHKGCDCLLAQVPEV